MMTREVGAFPISIATSLAIESAIGQYPEKPVQPAPILAYDEFWVNVKTLFRNYLGAYEKNEGRKIPYDKITDDLFAEMENIKTVLRQHNPKINVVFYVSDYQISTTNKHVVLRTDKTPLKQEFTRIYKAVVTDMQYRLRKQNLNLILFFKNKIDPPKETKAMMLTHIAYDLLSHYSFEELVLIESHTGTIKKRVDWHTKFNGSQDLSNIPFNEPMLRIFGDKEVFEPAPHSIRDVVYRMAVEDRWTQITTLDRIKFKFNSLQDRYTAAVLKSLTVIN